MQAEPLRSQAPGWLNSGAIADVQPIPTGRRVAASNHRVVVAPSRQEWRAPEAIKWSKRKCPSVSRREGRQDRVGWRQDRLHNPRCVVPASESALCQRAEPRTSMGQSNSTTLHVFPREFINHQQGVSFGLPDPLSFPVRRRAMVVADRGQTSTGKASGSGCKAA